MRDLRQSAQALFKKKTKSSAPSKKPVYPSFHLRMVNAELMPNPFSIDNSGGPILCRVLLSDLTSRGILLFSSQPLAVGHKLQLTIDQPRRFFANVRVVALQNFLVEKKILYKDSYPYRVCLEFVFESPQEEMQIKEYCRELQSHYVSTLTAA